MDLPIYVHRNRIGERVYLTFQRNRGTPHQGPRIPIRYPANTPDFWTLYNALMAEKPGAVSKGSVAAMIAAYRASPEWASLKAGTQRNYGIYLDIFDERLGDVQADEISPRLLLEMRDSFADRPVTANHVIGVIKTLYKFGIPREYAKINPAREIQRFVVRSDGMQPWPDWALDMAMTQARWEVSTFVALGLYTGQRTSDILDMRLQDIDGGLIAVKQNKTDKPLMIPIHAKLKPFIAACRKRGIMHLVSGRGGQPLDTNRWRAIWQREIAKAKFKALADADVAPHGLRKSAVVRLREVGVPIEEIQAITGQSRPMVEHYAKGVDQKMMATRGMQRWEAGEVVQIRSKRPSKQATLDK